MPPLGSRRDGIYLQVRLRFLLIYDLWFKLICFLYFLSATVAVGLYGNDDVHNAVVRFSSTLRAIQHNIDAVRDQV